MILILWMKALIQKYSQWANSAMAITFNSEAILRLFLHTYTLYNTILRIARNFLETRENIKISTHPFYHINLGWFSWEWSKKKIFFFEKKIQNGRLKKSSFFKIANSWNFFAKISEIGPWVSRIEWCEGHWCGSTYIAVKLSDICSKTGKNAFFV